MAQTKGNQVKQKLNFTFALSTPHALPQNVLVNN